MAYLDTAAEGRWQATLTPGAAVADVGALTAAAAPALTTVAAAATPPTKTEFDRVVVDLAAARTTANAAVADLATLRTKVNALLTQLRAAEVISP